MNIQIITTANGDELVVLDRRDYDALLARAGDEEAEDRMTRRILARHAAEPDELAPDWLTDAVMEGHSPVRAARLRAGRSLADAERDAAIGSERLAALEDGTERGTPEELRRLADLYGVDARWLLDEDFRAVAAAHRA